MNNNHTFLDPLRRICYLIVTLQWSVEIGHGSVLIRHPSSIPCEEESEASSLSFDNKKHSVNEAYSLFSSLSAHTCSSGIKSSSTEARRSMKPGQKIEQDQLIREKVQQEKLQSLANPSSTLCYIKLKDVKRKNSTGSSVAAGDAATAFASALSIFWREEHNEEPEKSINDSMKKNYENKDLVGNDGTCFSPKSHA